MQLTAQQKSNLDAITNLFPEGLQMVIVEHIGKRPEKPHFRSSWRNPPTVQEEMEFHRWHSWEAGLHYLLRRACRHVMENPPPTGTAIRGALDATPHIADEDAAECARLDFEERGGDLMHWITKAATRHDANPQEPISGILSCALGILDHYGIPAPDSITTITKALTE